MVHKIEFAGKEYDCEVGLAFLGEILEVLDLSISELGARLGKNPFKYLPPMIAVSIQTAADLDGKEIELSVKDVVKFIEEDGGMMSKGGVKFLDLFDKYMTKGLPKPKVDEMKAEKEPKKKEKENPPREQIMK